MEKLKDDQKIRAKRLRQLLSSSQKNDIKKAFDYFDQGGAGKIKKKELKVILRALGFDPSSDDLDNLIEKNTTSKEEDMIDFQEFMDIMLSKIEEKLRIEDIKLGFKKIANIKGNNYSKKHITEDDIQEVAERLEEKLTNEEVEEMLNEAISAGKLLNKDKSQKEKRLRKVEKPVENLETMEDDMAKQSAPKKKIDLHEFKAILTWENN